ncbi:hypothetical protein MFLAVUS_000772 [Mucor flavus]|uniref:RING-type domain-containing protein n=1 Tax=Mucor flavus TaxID=439312 RepID=A0ABP9YKM6_9FUNG
MTEINVESNKKQRIENTQTREVEDEHITCTICSEVWTSGGEHCLVSLKCGHLFGKSCIARWITERAQKLGDKKTFCPICMKPARLNDIRIVVPIKLVVKDTAEINLLKKEVEMKKSKICEYQNTLELARLSLNLSKRELKRAQDTLL